MNTARPSASILWLQVWGLAAVQAAITLAWLVYGSYLPDLLNKFGFAVEFGATLFLIENILAIVLEPLMGGLSDRAQRWMGTRYPFIVVGVILSSALFIAIPAVVIFGSSFRDLQWLFVTVVIAWAIAMTIFRSPVTSLLFKYSPKKDFPKTASALSLVTSLVGAIRPLSHQFILSLGSAPAFAIGSFVMLGAAAFLRSINPNASVNHPVSDSTESSSPDQDRSEASKLEILTLLRSLLIIFVFGMAIKWGTKLLIGDIFPRVLGAEIQTLSLDLMMGVSTIAIGVFSLPAGWLASRMGNQKVLLVSLGAAIASIGLLISVHGALITGVAIAIAAACFSTVANSAIPLALDIFPPSKVGLGIGMYFGGGAAASSLLGVLPAPTGLTNIAAVAAIAFLVAGICTAISDPPQPPLKRGEN